MESFSQLTDTRRSGSEWRHNGLNPMPESCTASGSIQRLCSLERHRDIVSKGQSSHRYRKMISLIQL
jgi:hypothetical protein